MSNFSIDVRRAGVDWCRLRAELDAAMMSRDDTYTHPPEIEWAECAARARGVLPGASERDVYEYAARLSLNLAPHPTRPPMAPREWAECRGAQALYFYRLGGSARGLDRFIDRARDDYYDGDETQQKTISPETMAELVRAAFERLKRAATSLDEPSLSIYHSTPAERFSDEKDALRRRDDKSNAAFKSIRSTHPELNGRALTDVWLRLMNTPQSEWALAPKETP
jgi:hypothetical protein